MNWGEYKRAVEKSREFIVFPFFDEHLSRQKGIGVDIGCGDGDLTHHLSSRWLLSLVGVDKDIGSLNIASSIENHRIHFIQGDTEKNIISSIGITFDFAVSNCCLSHISDQGIYKLFVDLHNCLKPGAELVFLVPCIAWAREMYSGIEVVPSGITAVPRYGGRQHFRLAEWYVAALEKCGFELVNHSELAIPDMEGLEPRYREKAGASLFSAFVAKRSKEMPNIKSLRKAFDVAHENRKLEITLFWQRSLFFWGFVATALVGYATSYGKNAELSFIFAIFGLICSVIWALGNRGSKYWQKYWEEKVNFYQHYTTGELFFDRLPGEPKFNELYAARRVSVSKLTMALSDYMILMWFFLCCNAVIELNKLIFPSWVNEYGSVLFVVMTLIYCLLVIRHMETED